MARKQSRLDIYISDTNSFRSEPQISPSKHTDTLSDDNIRYFHTAAQIHSAHDPTDKNVQIHGLTTDNTKENPLSKMLTKLKTDGQDKKDMLLNQKVDDMSLVIHSSEDGYTTDKDKKKKNKKTDKNSNARDYENEGARPKHTDRQKSRDRSATVERADRAHIQPGLTYSTDIDSEYENQIRQEKRKLKKYKSREHNDRLTDNERSYLAYQEKYGSSTLDSDSSTTTITDNPRRLRDSRKTYKEKIGNLLNRKKRESNKFSDSDSDSSSFDSGINKDRAKSLNQRKKTHALELNRNSDNNNHQGNVDQAIVERVLSMLNKNNLSMDTNLSEIFSLIPKNLANLPLNYALVSRMGKLLGGVPSKLTKNHNLRTFLSQFQCIETDSYIWSHADYNNLILTHSNTEIRDKIVDLDIDINKMKARDFIQTLYTSVVTPPPTRSECERLFEQYRFEENDHKNPIEMISRLNNLCTRAGMTRDQCFNKIKDKILRHYLPLQCRAAFQSQLVHSTDVMEIQSFFINNMSYINDERDRLKKVKSKGQTNDVKQVYVKKEGKKRQTRQHMDKIVEDNEEVDVKNVEQNGQNKQSDGQNKPVCEHCQRNHLSKFCMRHPNKEQAKKNYLRYRERLMKRRIDEGKSVCMLCSSFEHNSSECNIYPNCTPTQKACSICEEAGQHNRYHRETDCQIVKMVLQKNDKRE